LPWARAIHNEIERLFGSIKRFRRVFTRYDKTDVMFSAFVTIAFIADQLRSCERNLAEARLALIESARWPRYLRSVFRSAMPILLARAEQPFGAQLLLLVGSEVDAAGALVSRDHGAVDGGGENLRHWFSHCAPASS